MEMEADLEKQQWTNAIESILVAFDMEHNRNLKDRDALRMMELILDWLHFGDDEVACEEKIRQEGYEDPVDLLFSDCKDAGRDVFLKCLGAVYYVAKRRSKGRREYLDFIHHYVGPRVAEGVRILPNMPCDE